MKQFITFLFTFSLSLISAQTNLKFISNFGTNPGNLEMFSFSDSLNLKVKAPLIIVLHGCSQTAEEIERIAGWGTLARQFHFNLVFPQQKISNNASRCFNWFNEDDISLKNGEAESILQMIDYAKTNMNIDTSQIFIVGYSAGAAMSVSLLAISPSTFNSGVSYAGTAHGLAKTPGNALRVMNGKIDPSQTELLALIDNESKIFPSLIIYQGLDDHVVAPINADILVNQWTGLLSIQSNECLKTSAFNSNDLIEQVIYTNQKSNKKVIVYKIASLKHQIAIDPGTAENQGGVQSIFSKDVDFYSTYQIISDFGL
ncbi:MAG: PHB depolymerase family esterase [Crocinitomicaceae bacterium]|nr:MAG: PHB depolymerase family esterase [Crocinitomicaceae bacterium]